MVSIETQHSIKHSTDDELLKAYEQINSGLPELRRLVTERWRGMSKAEELYRDMNELLNAIRKELRERRKRNGGSTLVVVLVATEQTLSSECANCPVASFCPELH